MDKNEVLKILETAKDKNGEVPMRLVRQAFEKLPEPCEDTISRQAAIDAIEEYADRLQMVNWKENPNVPYKVHSLNWCINTIRDLPSAQPELEDKIRSIGYTGKEGRIYIGGRLFAVRELPQ